MVNNELRLAAASFHDAMKAVSAATDRLAAAVGAEADTPNPHERTREERNFLLQLRSRLREGGLPEILAAARMVPEIEGMK
jgi:hypothetical protein